jgi:hypothetical protein
MKEQLQRVIAQIEAIEAGDLSDYDRRLLAEAKDRLILVWQGGGLIVRHGMIVAPLDDPLVQEFIDEETDDGMSDDEDWGEE